MVIIQSSVCYQIIGIIFLPLLFHCYITGKKLQRLDPIILIGRFVCQFLHVFQTAMASTAVDLMVGNCLT